MSLPGRKAEAARNDTAILKAARKVFLRDPHAPWPRSPTPRASVSAGCTAATRQGRIAAEALR